MAAIPLLAAIILSPPSHAQQSDSWAPSPRIEMLLDSGAYDLALRRINDIQADIEDMPEWLEWENLRFDLYRRREDWDQMSDRLLNLPGDVPEIQRQVLMTRAAELLLESGNGESVREILRALIWRGSGDSRQLNYWRRLVVRSYLADDSTRDAGIAMTLYDREYLPADADWNYLFAQVLLRQGSAELAAQRLGSAQEPAARVLRLLSRLRAGVDTPQRVIERSAELRSSLSGNASLVAASWAATAEAALEAADLEARVDALEQLFNGPGLAGEFSLFELDVADLWRAYEALGTRLGNDRNMLFGDPEPWMAMARDLKGEGSALKARAINAAVARNSGSRSERDRLHLALYERLQAAELDTLAVRLYEADSEFPSVENVPDSVRHRIVSRAIEARNMKRAARFARHLAAPGTEQTQVQWDLTRARLALYDGDFSQSESILRSLILSREEFEPETADRVLQPIFDLQSVGRGEAAYELLQYMYERVTTSKQKRELLLWLGDALKTGGDYEAAAEHYLRSAHAAAGGQDQWGQSARYHAAEALAEARLLDDARRIYEQLLNEVGGGTRAAALQRRLQELWVKKQEQGRDR
ncbi:MAG: hypothetical protein U5R46_03290 [Gammaproteobacteria bacterium]|nr:hypothetical protein [Gammaproteobacteria bacterium]